MEITPAQMERLRRECNEKIELSNCLARLEKSRDFETIVNDYLHKEPIRLIHLLGEPSFNMSEKKSMHREELQERMIGIARCAEYLRSIHLQAEKAEQTLEDLRKAEQGE